MRQVTGSNLAPKSKRVSIQHLLGGHSSSVPPIPADICEADAAIEFVVNTSRVTLVPLELFEESAASDYLAVNGIILRSDEAVVWSKPEQERVAIMAINAELLANIQEQTGGREYTFTTPLLDDSHTCGDSLVVTCIDGVAYIRLYEETLQVAEAVEYSAAENILYYVARLIEIKGLKNIPIYIIGETAVKKLLKKYFKTVI